MQDASSVISQAAKGCVERIAERREISLSRMYEILGKDNPYPKAKVLIRDIGEFNKEGVRLIRIDMLALFDEILDEDQRETPSTSRLHKEAFEAIDAQLEGKPMSEQLAELRDLQAIVEQMIVGREKLGLRIA